ncbi:hypothetical protein [Absidia glauca]|uniref:Uncharacterized protein n=1 Tax=Absidia glauca TaxID=4829 RepID=A0A168M1J0_ABSGL|nr:hypothetical protein [Absidia glauca]
MPFIPASSSCQSRADDQFIDDPGHLRDCNVCDSNGLPHYGYDCYQHGKKKLSVANCFWRPGILFFVLTCGDQSIRLLNDSMNSQHFFDLCRKDLGTFTPLPATIIICDLQVQMDCITGFAAFCRDMIASTIYIFAVHYYVEHLVQELKRQHQDTVSMDYVRSRQSDTGTHHIDPVVIHPRTVNDGFMTETSIPG